MEKSVLCAGTFVVDIISGNLEGPVTPHSGFQTNITSNPGGNALNVAIDLVNLALPGPSVICCGAVGSDFEGQFLKSTLVSNGTIDRTKVVLDKGTSKSIILSFGNESRAFICDKGASCGFLSSDLLKIISDTRPSIFYIGESLASPDIDRNLPEILQSAKDYRAITVLDYIIYENLDKNLLFRCAPYADFIHLNEYEARIVTGSENIADAALFMREKGFPLVAISEGSKGFVLSYNNRVLHFPSFTVSCIDATGAGDAFCSGVIFKILETGYIPHDEEQLINMVLFASACGACAVTEVGCTKGVSLEKVQDLISSQGDRIRECLSLSM
jgi:sugar/nucleoside kinase (ribokinase family)